MHRHVKGDTPSQSTAGDDPWFLFFGPAIMWPIFETPRGLLTTSTRDTRRLLFIGSMASDSDRQKTKPRLLVLGKGHSALGKQSGDV